LKLDLGPVRSDYVTPAFGADDHAPLDPRLEHRLRKPMMMGAGVIGAFVIGLGAWAAFTPLSSGISAQAQVRVENNRKTLRSRESGTVKQILVKEGQFVRAGQPLLLFNDVEARAQVDVLQNQYDTLLAQNARYNAEATSKASLDVPAELTARMGDPRVAMLIRDQQFLFTTRLQLLQSQAAVLRQRIEQLETQVTGLQAQVASTDEQVRLTNEELDGYKKLNEQGYAPKTLILRYERSLADLQGHKGQLVSDIARMRQQMGETRLQLASLQNQRSSESAEGLRDTQSKLADVVPRLTAARQTLDSMTVRAPTDGYIFDLTQYTVGGVVGAGELLMDVVPNGTPLTVDAMIRPEDVTRVHVGQKARVRLTGLNPRWNDDLNATVQVVSADRISDQKSGASYYKVELRIDPLELKKLKRGVQLTPGMPATALIVTGERTVMGFLISPLSSTFQGAFREE